MRKRITKHEMKEDKLITTAFKFTEYFQKHLNQFLIGLGAVVVIAVIIGFYLSSAAGNRKKAAELFGKAQLEYQAGNLETALADMKTLSEKYSGTKVGGYATFLLANGYFYSNNFDLALATFQKYLDKYKNEDPLFSASAQAGIAQCQYTLGNFALAGDNFMKAASMAEEADFLAPQYLNLAGEAYALANMLDKAKAAYQKVIDQYKNTKYVNIARRNLAEIS